jgi:hypothetical protein
MPAMTDTPFAFHHFLMASTFSSSVCRSAMETPLSDSLMFRLSRYGLSPCEFSPVSSPAEVARTQPASVAAAARPASPSAARRCRAGA